MNLHWTLFPFVYKKDSATGEATQWEVHASQLESKPHSLQLEKIKNNKTFFKLKNKNINTKSIRQIALI